jgi:hypothetical protein
MKSELIYEEWRPVKNYEGLYEVSNFGRVRSLDHWLKNWRGDYIKKGKILRQGKQTNGYLQVFLCKDGRCKSISVHRLVYKAFNGNIPEGMEVNHINEIKTDNSVWNLNLMTRKENVNWGTAIKRRAENNSQTILQLTYPEGKFIKEWSSAAEAGRNGFNQNLISLCCNGKQKSHKGFLWRKKC